MTHKKQLYISILGSLLLILFLFACKTKKNIQKTTVTQTEDTLQGKCHLLYRTSKALTKNLKQKEIRPKERSKELIHYLTDKLNPFHKVINER